MKRTFALLTALTIVWTIAGCQSSADSETGTASSNSTSSNTTSQVTTPPTTATGEKFEEIVLVDNDTATVKITGIEEDSIWGYTLKVFLDNKTDKELMFTVEKVSVNGFMIDPFWAAAVDGGKKANESISFMDSDFQDNGIEAVEEIALTLRVYDNGDWLAQDLINQSVTIKP